MLSLIRRPAPISSCPVGEVQKTDDYQIPDARKQFVCQLRLVGLEQFSESGDDRVNSEFAIAGANKAGERGVERHDAPESATLTK